MISEVETQVHIFFQCPFFMDIWRQEPFNLMTTGVPASNLVMGLCWLRSKLEAQLFDLACVVMWNIWNFRNGVLHGGDGGERVATISSIHSGRRVFHSQSRNHLFRSRSGLRRSNLP